MAENITTTAIEATRYVAQNSRIISAVPDWILFLTIGILAALIFKYLPDEIKERIKYILKNYGIFIALILFWIYFKDKWGLVSDDPTRWPSNISYASFILGLVFLLYELASQYLNTCRYNTTPFISNGVFGSCALHYDVGKYTIWYLGTSGKFSISSEGIVIPWPFAQKIAITPKVSWDFNGDIPISITQVFKVNLGRLPPKLKKLIERDSKTYFARDSIYFGLFSEPLRTENPSLNEFEDELERKHAKYNTMEEDFDDVATNKEKYAGHARRIKMLSKNDEPRRQSAPQGEE